MSCQGDGSGEAGVPLEEESVQAVDVRRHRVHYHLAVLGTVVEEDVQEGVVPEMTQDTDAGQRDPLHVSGGGGVWTEGRALDQHSL